MVDMQPHAERVWKRMQLQSTSEKAQSVRESMPRLWLVFKRKRKEIILEVLWYYIMVVPQMAALRRGFWETGAHYLIKETVIPLIVLIFLQVNPVSCWVGSWTSD